MERAEEERGERDREERKKYERKRGQESREGSPVSSRQRLQCGPLLPSTAFPCKHCHPICDTVNWFFDVSRKMRIEKNKQKTGICLSPRTPIYLFFKIVLIPKGFLLAPPKSPLPLSDSHHLRSGVFLGVMVVGFFFFFFRGLIFTC